MSTEFNRPGAAYAGRTGSTNRNKYQQDQVNSVPIDPTKVDGDFNYVIDSLNTLNDSIDSIAAGGIPGTSTSANANKLLTTDGAGGVSWTDVGTSQIGTNAVSIKKLQTGTSGELITWGDDSQPTTVATGTNGQVLTSNGNGLAPSFQSINPLNKGGDTMQGSLGLFTTFGGFYSFENGNGNGASYTTQNITLKGEKGLGLYDNNTNCTAYYDFQLGILDVKGGYKINGVNVGTAATKAQQEAGTETSQTVTPANQKYNKSAIKAWISYDQVTGALFDSYNVTSVTETAPSDIIVSFTNAFANTNYGYAFGSFDGTIPISQASYKTTTSFRAHVQNLVGTAAQDNNISLVFFGTLA